MIDLPGIFAVQRCQGVTFIGGMSSAPRMPASQPATNFAHGAQHEQQAQQNRVGLSGLTIT